MSIGSNHPCDVALANLVLRGYEAQGTHDLDEAERLYRAALALNPNTFDALHMLGVVRLEKGDAEEAVRLLLAALPLLSTDYPPIYRNLGLSLGAVAERRGLTAVRQAGEGGRAHEGFYRASAVPALPAEHPLVTIVMPCVDEARSAAAAISSIAEQTYRSVEMIIVDGGLQESSIEAIKSALSPLPFPAQLVQHNGRGIASALNHGIARAQGKYVGIIDCDGLYRHDRVEKFVRILAGHPARWGFSNLAFIDDQSNPVRYGALPRIDSIMRDFDALYACHAVSASVPDHDYPLSVGNLLFEKSLWQQAGGFPDCRHYAAWAFSLSAIVHAEPAYLDEPAYVLRLSAADGSNSDSESRVGERTQIKVLWERLHGSLDGVTNATLLGYLKQQRRDREFAMMKSGHGHQIERVRLLQCAADLGFRTVIGR